MRAKEDVDVGEEGLGKFLEVAEGAGAMRGRWVAGLGRGRFGVRRRKVKRELDVTELLALAAGAGAGADGAAAAGNYEVRCLVLLYGVGAMCNVQCAGDGDGDGDGFNKRQINKVLLQHRGFGLEGELKIWPTDGRETVEVGSWLDTCKLDGKHLHKRNMGEGRERGGGIEEKLGFYPPSTHRHGHADPIHRCFTPSLHLNRRDRVGD
ncbi:hypothetical protein HYALB_00001384 [Hymenoscyphus albidus]|uniref:Uncharacterized protein n=1 Tax=Hymenoscyphus albidus TaxID=595503 RepID=A0A9N9PX09_9HELO|nr:hypothetical protein HYALB_00001384 [Hymenoscyphus albidus]